MCLGNQKVLRNAKVRAENELSEADTAMELLLQRLQNASSSDTADREIAEKSLEGACKLITFCEPANEEDVKR